MDISGRVGVEYWLFWRVTFLFANNAISFVVSTIPDTPPSIRKAYDHTQCGGVIGIFSGPIPVGGVVAASPTGEQLKTDPELEWEIFAENQEWSMLRFVLIFRPPLSLSLCMCVWDREKEKAVDVCLHAHYSTCVFDTNPLNLC